MEATQPSVAPSRASLSLLPLPLSTPSPPPSPASPSPSPLPLPTPSPPPSDNGHSHLLGRLILGILIVLVVVLSYFLYKRVLFPILKRRYRQKGSLKDESIKLRRFQSEELVKATNNFNQDCLLGSGAFGNVYKGTFGIEGAVLAIKSPHAGSNLSGEEFRNVRLLSKVRHRNLVGLVGFCEQPGAKGGRLLVYEYVPNGSLLEYITGRRESLTWRQRATIAIGAAKGIAHLHEGVKPSIIHRDIKLSNILIGDGFEAKVSDFGLVKSGPTGDQSHVSSQVKGTPGYMDPAYCSSFHLTPFSDVYSFGVILLQLVAARPAVYTGQNRSNYHIIEWARPSLEQGSVVDVLDANLLSQPCNMEMMLKMGQLGLRCVMEVPKQRPTMTQVWRELEEALYSVENFINKQPPIRGPGRSSSGRGASSRSIDQGPHTSMDRDFSQSFVSVNGVGFQRFHVDMDSLSFQSASLRCLEDNSLSVDFDRNSLNGN
ncbi:probable serine/threonine-protein kinase PBL22 isoform X2 [Alnus glutinosa]|uniref:probable serine/threonine-protein kinase PBL22 isoform X2 n=1 Tax=Alnus glutinosa TaxID=3517 RepID=UPI002D781B2C|nr:probable serine/threonine-protein kinase PBL22 isoform X2 [Alnus glutinosa]